MGSIYNVSLSGRETAADGGFSKNVGTTSTVVLAANASRKGALIVNYSDTLIWLKLGDAAEAGKGIPLTPRVDANNPGGHFEITQVNLYTGLITAIHGGSGNKALVGMEV